jgi:hypothetical protein
MYVSSDWDELRSLRQMDATNLADAAWWHHGRNLDGKVPLT